ncbi:hypothetical protein SH601_04585 [Gracilibacillus sp. S3-1-1]|uniref:Uncharacterized protein n=1 Tax=Gracilibacillus pellucidus TaxID=3095368 RepID=A0ACC6M2Y7_9BACI|nr:hypothetical protein [Gracilibacillus sp. S3-1-1]MDX8045258.1 hypothetical protein [Gracilibacillus sp. S3-1-1]
MGDLVEQNLRFYLEQMTEDGIWNIPWECGSYSEAFAVTRRYWTGVLLIDRYKIVKLSEILID